MSFNLKHCKKALIWTTLNINQAQRWPRCLLQGKVYGCSERLNSVETKGLYYLLVYLFQKEEKQAVDFNHPPKNHSHDRQWGCSVREKFFLESKWRGEQEVNRINQNLKSFQCSQHFLIWKGKLYIWLKRTKQQNSEWIQHSCLFFLKKTCTSSLSKTRHFSYALY